MIKKLDVFLMEFGPHPSLLVYVHCFKPVCAPVPDLVFYSVSFSFLNHCQCASVILVSDII